MKAPQLIGCPMEFGEAGRRSRLAKVIAHIEQHFADPLPLNELAHMTHWSRSQFQRNFKRNYRVTPLQFIHRVRLRAARERLKNPRQNITQVAFDTGFSSSAYFTSQFKRHTGETPSEYRRRQFRP